jgi:hypothetical protein
MSLKSYMIFNPEDIVTGPPVHIRKKLSYTGHATTTYSVEQASTIIDYIGTKTGCDNCLPFAVMLVEGGELISIAEGIYCIYICFVWACFPCRTVN